LAIRGSTWTEFDVEERWNEVGKEGADSAIMKQRISETWNKKTLNDKCRG
jgi:hypothetical protein